MAKKKTKSAFKQARLRPRMRKHIFDALGFSSERRYFSWCAEHRFSPSSDKSNSQLDTEFEEYQRQKIQSQGAMRLNRDPKKIIDPACAGTLQLEFISGGYWQDFARVILESDPAPEARSSLRELLHHVRKHADFLVHVSQWGGQDSAFIKALVKINDQRGAWRRTLSSWKPASHNRDKQFSSLLRHLLAQFPVPVFMDSVWFHTDAPTEVFGEGFAEEYKDWFIHIGAGKNIRTAATPFPLTKRMAHEFLLAPDSYRVEHALRWGQIRALGGDKKLIEEIIATPIGADFAHPVFWHSVFAFLVENPMLDRLHVGPIIDFLRHQKFEYREVMTGPGQVENLAPPQPGLSMRGRTAEGLLRQVGQWHQELGRTSVAASEYFKRTSILEYEEKLKRGKREIWRIRQLLSGKELIIEGREMKHCVASYAVSCSRGRCSIWSMERQHKDGPINKHQTIEVSANGDIVQCRGKSNRRPTASEFAILKKWADTTGLQISPYVVPENS